MNRLVVCLIWGKSWVLFEKNTGYEMPWMVYACRMPSESVATEPLPSMSHFIFTSRSYSIVPVRYIYVVVLILLKGTLCDRIPSPLQLVIKKLSIKDYNLKHWFMCSKKQCAFPEFKIWNDCVSQDQVTNSCFRWWFTISIAKYIGILIATTNKSFNLFLREINYFYPL